MSAFLRFAFAVSVAVPLAAQAPLVVKTADEDAAEGLLETLGSREHLPQLEEGSMWRITLDDGGVPAAEMVEAEGASFLQLEARPGELMAIFDAQVSQAQAMAQGMGAMGLAQAGIKTTDAIKLIRGVFDFPKQIELARITVDGDPEDPAQGFDVAVTLTPAADTWLGDVMDVLVPKGGGVPVLANEDAAMTARVDADFAALAGSFDWLNDLIASMGARSKSVAAKRLPLMQKYWQVMDSTAAMSFDMQGGGMVFLASLSDPEGMKAIHADPEFLAWSADMQQMSPGMEAEMTLDAFEHRGVSVARTLVTADDDRSAARNPFMVDGEAVGYAGVAGKYLVSTVGASKGEAEALIDRALDDELGSEKLPPNTLAVLTMNIGQIMAGAMQGMPVDPDVPESIQIDVRNFGGKLDIAIAIR